MEDLMKYFVVDAFTDAIFTGNPAGICLLDAWPEESLLQGIATQNNLSETAFLVKEDGHYALRWFTPEFEIDLCGHATLASAFVLFSFVEKDAVELRFTTLSGMLTVAKRGDLYEMDFPARPMKRIAITPQMETRSLL